MLLKDSEKIIDEIRTIQLKDTPDNFYIYDKCIEIIKEAKGYRMVEEPIYETQLKSTFLRALEEKLRNGTTDTAELPEAKPEPRREVSYLRRIK